MGLLQGLELLTTVLLARNRQPPLPVGSGVPHAEFAAELISLPSALLAMVCDAIVQLKVRLGGTGVRVRALRLPELEAQDGAGACSCRRGCVVPAAAAHSGELEPPTGFSSNPSFISPNPTVLTSRRGSDLKARWQLQQNNPVRLGVASQDNRPGLGF
jgi:hypothetical protein